MKLKGLSILAVIIIIITGIWHLYRFSYNRALAHAILITNCNKEIHPTIQESMKSWCSDHCSLINTTKWIHEFKQAFPIIDHIVSKKEASNALIVSIQSKKLKARVNNDRAVDVNGKIFPLSYFDEKEAVLPQIITKESVESDEKFKEFIQHVPLYILEQYTIEWRAPHEIYLKPKRGAPIITRYNLIPAESWLTRGIQLCSERPEKRGKMCAIDMRFNDQIVIFDTRGR